MNALLHVKRFFSVTDTAEYLSSTFGGRVSFSDVIRLVIEGHLRLAVNLLAKPAREVALYTPLGDSFFSANNGGENPKELRASGTHLSSQGPQVRALSGCYFYLHDEEDMSRLLEWLAAGNHSFGFQRAVAVEPTHFQWSAGIGLSVEWDGLSVSDEDGTRYVLMESEVFGEDDDRICDIQSLPNPETFIVLASDIQKYEARARAQPTSDQAAPDAPLRGTERQHFLKVIAGLLSKAGISKRESVTEIRRILEVAGQQNIDRDALAKTFKQANDLRP